MLTKEQEDRLYLLSDTLGVEIYVVGVGDKAFLPAQESRPSAAATREGALAEWMMACLDASEEIPWWTHTHPAMSAFFSTTDVEGAHNLWGAIRRPIMATVLGKDGERHDVVIDGKWIEEHPKPKPIMGFTAESWGPKDDLARHGHTYDSGGWVYSEETGTWVPKSWQPMRSLASDLIDLIRRHGWTEVHEAVRDCAHMAYSLDDLPEELKDEVRDSWAEQALRDAELLGSFRPDVMSEGEEECPGCGLAPKRRSDLPGACSRCGALIDTHAGR